MSKARMRRERTYDVDLRQIAEHERQHKAIEGPKDAIKHVLSWHLKGRYLLKRDIIGIFEAHGLERDVAEYVVAILEKRGELREAYPGGWTYEPKGGDK